MPQPLDLQVDRNQDLPIGAQLARKLRGLVEAGTLRPGDRLPSIRELAASAGVNVNTVRAVYSRLENEGIVATEHGRGTFVVDEAAMRRRLRNEIASLERELVKHGPIPPPSEGAGPPRSALLTAKELEEVRDLLVARLLELDAARAEILERLEELRRWSEAEERGEEEALLEGRRPAGEPGDAAERDTAARDAEVAALLRRLKGPLTA